MGSDIKIPCCYRGESKRGATNCFVASSLLPGSCLSCRIVRDETEIGGKREGRLVRLLRLKIETNKKSGKTWRETF